MISSLGLQKRRSKTVIASPEGVFIPFALRTAGAGIIVWSTVKLSSSGILDSSVRLFALRDAASLFFLHMVAYLNLPPGVMMRTSIDCKVIVVRMTKEALNTIVQ
jgi:hypothetical protein